MICEVPQGGRKLQRFEREKRRGRGYICVCKENACVVFWLAQNVVHIFVKPGCQPAQDAIQKSNGKLFSTEINHSITRRKL